MDEHKDDDNIYHSGCIKCMLIRMLTYGQNKCGSLVPGIILDVNDTMDKVSYINSNIMFYIPMYPDQLLETIKFNKMELINSDNMEYIPLPIANCSITCNVTRPESKIVKWKTYHNCISFQFISTANNSNMIIHYKSTDFRGICRVIVSKKEMVRVIIRFAPNK